MPFNLSPENLARYMTQRLGTKTEIDRVSQFSRGTSRQTWFVDCIHPKSDERNSFVFRLDFPGGSVDPAPLDQEYFIYERLGRTDVPVAAALWWEADPAWTDQPFYVRKHVVGDWRIPHFSNPDPAYDPLRVEICREHLRNLALVHKVDWRSLDFGRILPVPPAKDRCAQTYIEQLGLVLDSYRVEALPIFLEAAEWLRSTAPAAPCICLCKGTNGLGEEIFRDGQIVAMSDWEEASIGDPAADFAFMQGFLPEIERDGVKLWGLEPALEYYRELSGIEVSVASVRYYQNLRALKSLLYSHKSALAVHLHEDAPIRQAWVGTEVAHASKRLLAASVGLLPNPEAAWIAEFNTTIDDGVEE